MHEKRLDDIFHCVSVLYYKHLIGYIHTYIYISVIVKLVNAILSVFEFTFGAAYNQ